MDFLSQAVAAAVPSCIGPVLKNIAYPFKVSHNVNALDVATTKLTDVQADVKNRVENAERQGLPQKNVVAGWLRRVDAAKREVDEIRKRYRERSRCLGRQSFNCWSNYLISKDAAKMLTDQVQKLCDEGDKLVDVAAPRPLEVLELPVGSEVVPKEEEDLQKIRRYIDNDNYDIIGIWGMGGVGKTRLLHLVNNSYKGSSAFDVVVKVTASKGCSVEKIQAELCEKCGFGRETNVELQASIISNNLSNHNFLILLDDLWDHIDLQSVGIPFPLGLFNQFKRKVVITTRLESVCSQMRVKECLKVDGLDPANALRLFKENVGDKTINFHHQIKSLAEKIVKELGGLPLALITIGRSMSDKKNPRDWQNAIDLLQRSGLNEIDVTRPEEHRVFYKLKLSYDYLESENLRNCFLACSLWPEGHGIPKTELIECWMGLGLLDWDIYEATNIYNPGYVVIGKLLSACLLEEEGSKHVKMHDVIRDIALWLAHDCGTKKDKWVVQREAGVNELIQEKDRWPHVERATLFAITQKLVNLSIPCNASKLEFLMLGYFYIGLEETAVVKNLRSFCSLTFLHMSSCKLSSFPQDICNLVNLRHLNLSNNRITSIPEELKLVRNLRCLFLKRNPIASFPELVILELKKLLLLDLYGSGGEYLIWVIKELECLRNIRCLSITLKHPTHFKSLLELSNLPIRSLQLDFVNETDTLVMPSNFIGNSKVQNNLHQLVISVKSVSKIVTESNSQSHLRYLQSLSFSRMEMLETIEYGKLAPKDLFPILDTLSIRNCGKLKDVSWTLYLPCLRILNLHSCNNIVQLIEHLDAANATESIFPSLEEIEILFCPMLKKLPFKSNTIPEKLRIIRIAAKCWERLEWEDDDVKQILEPFRRSPLQVSSQFLS